MNNDPIDHLSGQPAEILQAVFGEVLCEYRPCFVNVMRLSLTCRRFCEIMQTQWNAGSFGLINLCNNKEQQPWWTDDVYVRQLLMFGIPLPAFLRCKEYIYGNEKTLFRGRAILLRHHWMPGYTHAYAILQCYIATGQYEEAARVLTLDDTGLAIGDGYLRILHTQALKAGPDAAALADLLRCYCRFVSFFLSFLAHPPFPITRVMRVCVGVNTARRSIR
jgi:hypothetical protein